MGNQQRQRQSGRGSIKLPYNPLLTIAGGGIGLVALLVIASWQSGTHIFEALHVLLQPKTSRQVDVRSLIVHQVRSASELTTAVLAVETVVPTRQDRTLGGLAIGTTTLLYIGYGEVRAGVDLSQLKASDVSVQSNIIQLRLPPPRILDSKIDVNRSQVYDYSRGFLALGPDVAPQLQTLAEQESLKKIVATACRQGLLRTANDRAQLVVSHLLNVSGYKQVEVKTTLPSLDCSYASSDMRQ